jgi:CheY-like chemotaxis protein
VRVLVVDDDPEIFEVFRAVADHDPVIDLVGASSPEEAMAVSREVPPDAILLDHNFPTANIVEHTDVPTRASRGMTGLEAVEFLRSAAPDAVIAIYTGSRGLEDSVENAGADLYLVKGPDPKTVLGELADRARQRRSE